MKNNISVAVLGSTGYVGIELVYLLSQKDNINIKFLGSENSININIESDYRNDFKIFIINQYWYTISS